eukprot:CAMPEP_0170280936 /NCGR_PEP_ID=MMETSP0116_2-20130129/40488_1 /TAXON_ID=400756 /ORGANISM="Durinskia baltica, Strain CSIRO CS-38" /LENGTH=303 /DNA_ID=CAMNT_0010532279 /DNA_START=174 /DNA_END=1082 /DNA_ORIENTATION=+
MHHCQNGLGVCTTISAARSGTATTARCTSANLALKVLNLEDPVNRERFDHEKHFLERFNSSKYIVGYRGSLDGMTPGGRRGVIFMEKGDGNLGDVIAWRNQQKIPDNDTHRVLLGVAVDILRGLGELADYWCVHHDLTPSNVLVFGNVRSGRCRAKLADFGGAGNVQRTVYEGYHPHGAPSKHAYVAPELLAGTVTTPRNWLDTDVWAAGVLLAELFSGSLPARWDKSAMAEGWTHRAAELHRALREHIESGVFDEEVRRLILKMVHPVPWRRPRMQYARQEAERIAMGHGLQLPPREHTGQY